MFSYCARWLGGLFSRTRAGGCSAQAALRNRVRPLVESLEDRLALSPVTFTFKGWGTVPTGSPLPPDTAYLRVQLPTRQGDEVDINVSLTSDAGPGEIGEVLWDSKEFEDAKGNPSPKQ